MNAPFYIIRIYHPKNNKKRDFHLFNKTLISLIYRNIPYTTVATSKTIIKKILNTQVNTIFSHYSFLNQKIINKTRGRLIPLEVHDRKRHPRYLLVNSSKKTSNHKFVWFFFRNGCKTISLFTDGQAVTVFTVCKYKYNVWENVRRIKIKKDSILRVILFY